MFEITNINNDVFASLAPETGAVVRSTTTDDTATLFNAVNGNGTPVKQILGQDIYVTDIVITSADVPVDINKPEGDKINKPVVNFFTEEGEHYTSLSNGVIRATKNMLACGLTPTPENPIHLKFKTIETSKGIAHTFDLVKDN